MWPFLLSLSSFLIFPIWFSTLHFHAFTPYLMFRLHRDSLDVFLWKALGCGLCIDLFSSSIQFGQTPLIYVLLGAVLHRQRRHFFIDKLPTLFLLTLLFTSLTTLGAALFDFFTKGGFYFTWRWVWTDLMQMPLVEGTFALIFFSLPFQLREKWRKIQTTIRLRA